MRTMFKRLVGLPISPRQPPVGEEQNPVEAERPIANPAEIEPPAQTSTKQE